mmetsp:Transcript_2388/g.6025  ORF Transcript_2388/g.6025 Transcript_2388/m.6025 type:complete len:204 (+) Transcript_2388:247-858(+)
MGRAPACPPVLTEPNPNRAPARRQRGGTLAPSICITSNACSIGKMAEQGTKNTEAWAEGRTGTCISPQSQTHPTQPPAPCCSPPKTSHPRLSSRQAGRPLPPPMTSQHTCPALAPHAPHACTPERAHQASRLQQAGQLISQWSRCQCLQCTAERCNTTPACVVARAVRRELGSARRAQRLTRRTQRAASWARSGPGTGSESRG